MVIKLNMALYRTFHAQKNKIRPGREAIGLSLGQPKILDYLSKHNHCMQKDLAFSLDIEPATVSRILNKMVQAGLIERSTPSARKRAESVSITDKGLEYYEKWLRLCESTENISMKGFSKDEQEQFIEYLCRMYKNLTGRVLE